MNDGVLRPQSGPQEKFLATPADICIYGGSAGGGKSYALLLEALRHIDNPNFGAVIFRKSANQITAEGGLWDTSFEIYLKVDGHPKKTPVPTWVFPSGAKISFHHMSMDKDVHAWQGSQIPLIAFDELTHFCLAPETEVLTESGWKKIADVKIGEKVPSLSVKGKIELKSVLDTPSFDYDGEMIDVYQQTGVSARMTPNHKIPVKSQSKNDDVYRFIEADHLTKRMQCFVRTGDWASGKEVTSLKLDIPKGRGLGNNINAAESILMDDWLEFLGWYLSEGSSYLANASKGGTSPCVSIRQRKKAPTLDALMKRLPWRSVSDGDGGHRIYSRQLYEIVHPIGNCHVSRIPRYVFKLSKRQQKIFFDAFVKGDGYVAKTGLVQIGLCNEKLIDDLNELITYLGYTGTTRHYVTKTGFDVYQLSVTRRTFTCVKPRSVRKIPYKGKVHCLTVEDNHTFLVRHRGRTHWTGNSQHQFFYMLSRNRSACGVKPYVRATCNPDADSWVAKFIEWWIDQETGYAIPERSGVLRWMYRLNNEIHWGDTKEELWEKFDLKTEAERAAPKSVTFIASKLTDNKALMDADPGYMANLLALPTVERERLLGGNWKIRPAAGLVFPRQKANVVEVLPTDVSRWVRAWDLAATASDNDDPDKTACVLLGKQRNGRYIVADVKNKALSAYDVRAMVKSVAQTDKKNFKNVKIRLSQDPGQAGKDQAEQYIKMLAGFSVKAERETGDKVMRSDGFASQWQAGNVDVLLSDWTDMYLDQMDSFPQGKHDDMVDASSNAFNEIEKSNVIVPFAGFGSADRSNGWRI